MENGAVLIAATSASASLGLCVIRVWQWTSKEDDREEVAREEWMFWKVVGFLLKLMVVFAAMAYVRELVKQAMCKFYFLSCS